MQDIAFIFAGFVVGTVIGLTGLAERVIRALLSVLLAFAGTTLIAI